MNGLCAIGLVAFGSLAFGTVVVLIDMLRPGASKSAFQPPTSLDDAASEVGCDGEFLSLQGVHDAKLSGGDPRDVAECEPSFTPPWRRQ